jgi:hypothetical protein
VPVRPDANHHADAREAAVRVLAEAMGAKFGEWPYLPLGLLPRLWLERIARYQLETLLSLPEPTRAALLVGRP